MKKNFKLLSANAVGFTRIEKLNIFLSEQNLLYTINAVTSEPALQVKIVIKYRHLNLRHFYVILSCHNLLPSTSLFPSPAIAFPFFLSLPFLFTHFSPFFPLISCVSFLNIISIPAAFFVNYTLI